MKPMVYRSPSRRSWMWSCECSPGIVHLLQGQLAAFESALAHSRGFQHQFLAHFQDKARGMGWSR